MSAAQNRKSRATGCAIEGCARPRKTRGWCGTHYERWRKWGDPEIDGYPHNWPEQVIAARTERQGDCLVWTGGRPRKDYPYGAIRVHGRVVSAHRYVYEHRVGPIPDGMFLDHVCHNRSCVEPEHLRPASPGENARYRAGPNKNSSTGHRGVYARSNGTFRVRVGFEGKSFGHTHDRVEDAIAEAEALYTSLHGDFKGVTSR